MPQKNDRRLTLEVKLESGCGEKDDDVPEEVILKEPPDSSESTTGKMLAADPDVERSMTTD